MGKTKMTTQYKASVIIPVKNGGALFKDVLKAVLGQKLEGGFEVLVIDSGSTDGSLEFTQKLAETNENLRCHKLPPKEFGHGKTRNLGAELTTGRYIAFITHDALPYNDQWLEKITEPMETDSGVAGVFGKHLPYEDADIFEKDNLKRHFENFGTEMTIFSIEDKERYKNDEAYRHFLCFYSDNCSCMRRSVWEKIPYEDVNFAEDQIWAKTILEAGYKKAYAPDAVVYHSHRYPTKELFMRYYDDYKNLYKIYKYRPVKSFVLLPVHILRHVRSDYRFLKTITIPRNEKKKWLKYSIIKNIMRYTGGYFGVAGANSDFMDRLFSRDFRIRGGK